MLDLGFEEEMTRLAGMLPPNHQTILFSATFPKAVVAIARNFMKKVPTMVTTG